MLYSESALSDGLRQITLIATALFGLGFFSGLYRRIAPVDLFDDEEQGKTVTMLASLGFAVLGGALAFGAAGWYLFVHCTPGNSCDPIPTTLWQGVNIPGGLQFSALLYVDRLAAFFVLLISGLSIGVSIYSFGWLSGDDQRNRVASFYNLFVLTLLYVVLADHVFFLLLMLEVATLAFGYLILYKHNRFPEVEAHHRAFTVYLIVSQISTVLILAAFLLLAQHAPQWFCADEQPCDVFSLSTFRRSLDESITTEQSLMPTLIFLLAFGGLSIRAGAFPLHFWVSLAHPSSPTTTHAMSLGIGIKIALYLMLRMFFEFLHPAAAWWGWVVLIIGGTTAVYNVFFAAVAHDLKRALAYHSVENIGIILVGIGLALAASAPISADNAYVGLVEIGLIAALYHLLNHTVFKSLLYLCTGIIEKRTGGAVSLHELGGVWRYYPWTAAAFLIGAIAIAGLPPFNGFISEWLTLAGLFTGLSIAGQNEPRAIGLIALVAGILLLALAFSLTVLAFAKIAGRGILGSPGDPKIWDKAQKDDAPLNMRGVVILLAALCLALGLFAPAVASFLADIAHDLHAPTTLNATATVLSFSIGQESEQESITARLALLPVFVLAGLFGLAVWLGWLRMRHARRGSVWVGGVVYEPHRMQYTGAAFTYWLWSHFARRGLPAATGDSIPDYVHARVEISARDHVTGLFRRAINALTYFTTQRSERIGNRLQSGNIRAYLLYILGAFFVALVLLLLFSNPQR